MPDVPRLVFQSTSPPPPLPPAESHQSTSDAPHPRVWSPAGLTTPQSRDAADPRPATAPGLGDGVCAASASTSASPGVGGPDKRQKLDGEEAGMGGRAAAEAEVKAERIRASSRRRQQEHRQRLRTEDGEAPPPTDAQDASTGRSSPARCEGCAENPRCAATLGAGRATRCPECAASSHAAQKMQCQHKKRLGCLKEDKQELGRANKHLKATVDEQLAEIDRLRARLQQVDPDFDGDFNVIVREPEVSAALQRNPRMAALLRDQERYAKLTNKRLMRWSSEYAPPSKPPIDASLLSPAFHTVRPTAALLQEALLRRRMATW